MVTPVDLSIWLREQAWPLAIIAGIVLFTYISLRVSAHNRRTALARERAEVTNETFTEYLAQFGFDPTIASSTYRYLQEVQNVRFPILASDNLDEDLGLGLDEVDQSVRELTAALDRELLPGLHQRQPITVEDLVRVIQASPRIVSNSRSSAA